MFGGKFESAMIRAMDAHNRPERNNTTHPYYLGLNRKTEPSYFHRAATLATLAVETVIVGADWSDQPAGGAEDGVAGEEIAVRHDTTEWGEWDDDNRDFVDTVLDSEVLPPRLRAYICHLILDDTDPESAAHIRQNEEHFAESIAKHYLCRLIFQIRRAQGTKFLLALDEQDMEILALIGKGIADGVLNCPFEMPDIPVSAVDGNRFGGAFLNFSPPDARALTAIRADERTAEYAKEIRANLIGNTHEDAERNLLRAMVKAYRRASSAQKIDSFFEISGWVVKPINYLPVIGTVTSIASDIKDVAQKGAQKRAEAHQWYLLSARATQVGIEDYLARKGNLLGRT